ncbi:MAG: DUF86 domain-containing protein [bacterium]
MRRDYRVFLKDALEHIQRIRLFTNQMDKNAFLADEKTQFAVVRCLEIIGEAVVKVPIDVQEKYPDIPWADMRNFRIIAAHQYWKIDLDIVWNIVQDHLHNLENQLHHALREDPDLIP